MKLSNNAMLWPIFETTCTVLLRGSLYETESSHTHCLGPTSAMKIIFSSPNLIEVTQLKGTLERAGIACFIRNESSYCLSPEIPLTDSTPELWLQKDSDLVEAIEIKRDWQASPNVTGNRWVCAACGETSEPQFTSCWKCGTPKL